MKWKERGRQPSLPDWRYRHGNVFGGKGKKKIKFHPITGHEGPERE